MSKLNLESLVIKKGYINSLNYDPKIFKKNNISMKKSLK